MKRGAFVPELSPSLGPEASRWELQAAWAALVLVVAVAAYDALHLHPGFAAYDEEGVLVPAQAWREGSALTWAFGKGSLHRALVAMALSAFGARGLASRLPALVAVALEGPLLWLWVRPRLGSRAAAWSIMALALSAATLMRARMVVAPALLPAVFLAHAVWLDRLRRPWHHVAFAASMAFWLLDYDGWLLGMAALLPWWAAALKRSPHGRRALAGAAAGVGLLLLISATDGALAAWWRTRMAVSFAGGSIGEVVWGNLKSLVRGGHRLAFSGVEGWPWPAPWTWPLAGLGLTALLGTWRAPLWLALVGAIPLAMDGSAAEIHRLALLQLALAVAAGAAAARLAERRTGRILLAVLWALGTTTELAAFLDRDPAVFQAAYGRSQDLETAARWLRDQAPPRGWNVLDDLGPYDDGPFRAMVDALGVKRSGGRDVILLHRDYWPALSGTCPMLPMGTGEVALAFPGPVLSTRLGGIRAQLEPLRRAFQRSAHPAELSALSATWLRAKGDDDPWARTIAWETWLHASLQSRHVDLGGVRALLEEPLVSGWAPDVLANELDAKDPALAARCRAKAVAVDPRRSGWSLARRTARY